MRVLYWIFILVLGIVAASFAVSNRQLAAIGLWPFDYSVEAPLYLALFAALALGFAIGRLFGFIANAATRRERNRLRIRVKQLEAENRSDRSAASTPAISNDRGLASRRIA